MEKNASLQSEIRPETRFEYRDKTSQLKRLAYVLDRFSYQRSKTREVKVGDLGIGGDNPIRVQSMTISDTQNIQATVDEAEQLAQAGCELVRITAPSQKDAECLKDIRQQLFSRGCRVPLCADIHFTPQAALLACEYVEKVRVNPGNFADKKVFAQREYSEREYGDELDRIFEKFSPLVLRAKEMGRALRIGTNHGSLSDRVMNQYGDTPLGMVESALEFVNICRHHGFHDIVISMKASNPKVMIQAYRLLVARMNELHYDYPLHLGVTEAGSGEDGRLKSAVGIGSLLEDGIGDTVRVSLTEDSIYEIPVVYDLVRRFCVNPNDPSFSKRQDFPATLAGPNPESRHAKDVTYEKDMNSYSYQRLETEVQDCGFLRLGGSEVQRVQIALDNLNETTSLNELKEILGSGQERAEMVEVPLTNWKKDKEILASLRKFVKPLEEKGLGVSFVFRLPDLNAGVLNELAPKANRDWVAVTLPLIEAEDGWLKAVSNFAKATKDLQVGLQWVMGEAGEKSLPGWAVRKWGKGPEVYAEILLCAVKLGKEIGLKHQMPGFEMLNPVASYRFFVHRFREEHLKVPILLREPRACPLTPDDLRSASVFGSLLCDGIGDAICVGAQGGMVRNAVGRIRFAYNLLQATGSRITKTEFVSCPSCGRTLFNLQETTARIQSKLGHLKGVKLAIMGCIVNGPGEMADAHFGYVGAGPGRINLYVGKECVQKNIPSSEADQRLIELIKAQGMWTPPAQ